MEAIAWNNQSYSINGKPGFLISGEFHYFRVPKEAWRTRLQLLKEAGMNCAATYVPWVIHEPEEGSYVFGDVPERDLVGFLELCREMQVYVLCRPGPYQYSEMYYAGLPEWLCRYDALLARDTKGEIFNKNRNSVSYLHPLFLDKVKKWFNAVCPIIKNYLISEGGPIALVQVDNELIGFHEWMGSWDYNVEAMGIGTKGGRYPKFLQERYQTIDPLNLAYNESNASFEAVVPCKIEDPAEISQKKKSKDYQDFYFSTVGEYVKLLAQMLRESGIDTGMVHNSASQYMNPYFRETVQAMGEGFLLGCDHYYNLGPDWDQNNPTPQYAIKVLYSMEMLRLMGFPQTVFEMPGGSASDWPPIMPEDLKCCYMLNAAFGLKGLNYYIFTGGPGNPFDISYRHTYDYGAPVGGDGSIRPIYGTVKSFNEFLNDNVWLQGAALENDFNVGLDWEISRSRHYFTGRGHLNFSNHDAWSFLLNGLLISAMNGSYMPGFIDLYSDAFTRDTGKPLVVSSSVCMAEAVQKNLIAFVKAGGKLILMPVIPSMDENFNKCTCLMDFLGGASVEQANAFVTASRIGNVHVRDYACFKGIVRPEKAFGFANIENTGIETGWKLEYENGGSVTWLGYYWRHQYFEQSSIIQFLLGELNFTTPNVCCDNPNVWAVLRSNGNRRMLFVINLFSSPMTAGLSLKDDSGSYTDIGTFKLAPLEVRTLEV